MWQILPLFFLLTACQKQESFFVQEEDSSPCCAISQELLKEDEAGVDEPLPFSHETLVEEGSEWIADEDA